jgi:hypothetical protein
LVTTLGHDGYPAWQVAPVFAAELRWILNGLGGVTDGFDRGWGEATREVEVCEGHVTGVLDEDVLGLEVAVGDAHAVEVVESADDLGQVETNNGGGENAVVLTVPEDVEVAAGTVWDGPGEEVRRIGGAEEGREERMGWVGKSGQDPDFPLGPALRVVLGLERGLLDNLESERTAGSGIRSPVVDEEDRAHGAFTQDFEGFKVVQV